VLDWKGKRVLIGGGAGFIGSHMAAELSARGAQVLALDNLQSGTVKNVPNGVDFKVADLRDPAMCDLYTDGMDVVFQFAANMGGIGFITSVGAQVICDNALINLNMIEAARRNRVKHYFYSSSACVYPDYKQVTAKATALKESDALPADPNEYYGWEKLFTEKVCESYQRDYGMNIRVARFHNIFGPAYNAFDTERRKAPCAMIMKAIQHPHPPFVIWGDGKAVRSYCYIDDCIEGVLKLMDSDYDKPVNIGSDVAVTVDELAQIAIALSGKRIKPVYDLSKPQGVRGRNSDNTLVKEVLGWSPRISLVEGMRITYQWALKHYGSLEGL